MNHPNPSNRTHAKGVPPLYLTPTEVGDTPTTKKNKTNPIRRSTAIWPPKPPRIIRKRTQFPLGPRPNYTKRTQFQPRRTCGGPKNAKRTQFYPKGTPNTQNEPNSRTPGVPPPPISAKRTQSHPVSTSAFRISCLFRISSFRFRISPDLSGRIMRNEPNFSRGGPVEDQKMQNEPNLRLPHDPNAQNEPNLAPHAAFPTFASLAGNSPRHPTIHHSLLTIHYFTKRTQFQYRRNLSRINAIALVDRVRPLLRPWFLPLAIQAPALFKHGRRFYSKLLVFFLKSVEIPVKSPILEGRCPSG